MIFVRIKYAPIGWIQSDLPCYNSIRNGADCCSCIPLRHTSYTSTIPLQ